uniref:Uncharacterized protein n=1 Tax=Jarrellvirus sp. TaxID=2960496 RepID=A0AAU8HXJ7_9CAUD
MIRGRTKRTLPKADGRNRTAETKKFLKNIRRPHEGQSFFMKSKNVLL